VSGVTRRRVSEANVACSICPGRYLANDTVWIAIARILAVFTISKAKDANGNVIEPEIAYVTTITRYVSIG
jgi:hypothetical protein